MIIRKIISGSKNLFFLLILSIIINLSKSSILFSYPYCLTLSNGNILVIHKTGIDICDRSLSEIIENVLTFDEDQEINSDKALSKVTSEIKDEYIFCIINDKIYIFNNIGELLYQSIFKILESGENAEYYTLVITKKANYCYYYIVGFIHNKLLYFLYYTFNYKTFDNSLINSRKGKKHEKYIEGIYSGSYNFENNLLTCQYMIDIYNIDVMVCFFLIYSSSYSIENDYYDIGNDKIIYHSVFSHDCLPYYNISCIKSTLMSDTSKALVGLYTSTGEAQFFQFNINLDNPTMNIINLDQHCRNEYFGLKINYYKEINKYSFSCIDDDGKIFVTFLNKSLKIYNSTIKYKDCEEIHGYSILYSTYDEKFYIMSDVSCQGKTYPLNLLYKDLEIENGTEIIEEKISENKENTENIENTENTENIGNEEETECKELEKCELCNKESISKKLCIKCNNKKGYYFLNNNKDSIKSGNKEYIDCINNNTKPSNFYFNEEQKEFSVCYEVCATCDYGGNGNKNNCTSCETNYILNPDIPNSTDCVLECLYYYYYTSYNQYRCTDNLICPESYNLLIKEKKKCTDDCLKEDIYKYQYNGICLKECPDGTTNDESNEFICKDKNIDKCILSGNKIRFDDNITESEIETMTKNFAREFQYTDNHVSLYQNNIYSIIIYKNSDCIFELNLEFPEIDFGECERKVKIKNKINDTLIIVIITKNIDGKKDDKIITYSMHEPTTGKKLIYEDICEDDIITLQENLLLKLDDANADIDSFLHLTNQNINIFNLSSEFYNDICYQFESPLDKDIALKDRILLFYPNITLCQEGCSIQGVNLTSFKAVCECKLNNKNNNIFGKNLIIQNKIGEIESLISETNIVIIKCYKILFNYKNIFTFLGGYIIFILLLIQIIMTFIYYKRSLYLLKKYIFNITDKYIAYLAKQKLNEFPINNSLEFYNKINSKNNAPPKRKIRLAQQGENENVIRKEQKAKTKFGKKRAKTNRNKKKMTFIKNIEISNLISKSNYQINLSNDSNQEKSLISKSSKLENKKMSKDGSYYNNILNKNSIITNSTNKEDSNIQEYLKTDLDDMDFDDALKKDNRKFVEYLNDNLKANQNIMNTFYTKEPLRPRTIKIILFILYIDLYLLINGLFFNEEYISEIFHSEKEENFFTFIPRSVDRIFYTTLVRGIIGYVIIFVFVEERKIKGIFKREKDSIVILKYQVAQILKSIITRFNIFITISFIIIIFTFYYSFCFNYIYPHMIEEWIKSSFLIIFIMQLISSLTCCLETIIRYISFKCKSEKIFKISLLFS